ncbi:MAG: glutamate-1-semialdehyde 2,1-aminomutase [Nitrospirae bacterium]|nr:glutamate-1-semialdehyde 2,1-aminomutase [Nitrospirota bacterium]
MTPGFRRSRTLYREALRRLVGGVSSPVRAFRAVGGTPLFVERARGAYVWDVDGNRYTDFVLSYGAILLGHADGGIAQAVHNAARRGSVTGSPVPEEIALARLVQSAFPVMERLRFVNSGTEAAMSAVRLARGFTGRSLVVKFEGCYHGHADGLLARAGSGAATFALPDSGGVPRSYVRETRVLPYNDVQAFRSLMAREGRNVAAVIVEPIAANMGLVHPEHGFLRTLRVETRRHGSVLLFDEVISGFRVRLGGAVQLFGVRPDLVCAGKVMGGGLPVGVYGGRKEIMRCLAPEGPVYQAGTLAGNRAAMAAGTAALLKLRSAGFYTRLERSTRKTARALERLAARHGVAVEVPWTCGLFTVFFTSRPVRNYSDAAATDRKAFSRYFHSALRHGLYVPPSPFEACFLSAAHTPGILEDALRRWDRVFGEMAAGGRRRGS